MIELVPYEAWHGKAMRVQLAQRRDASVLDQDMPANLCAVTILLDGETPLLIGGVAEIWSGRAMAWSIISMYACRHMETVTSMTKAFIENSGFRRVEMTVRSTFSKAHDWAKVLGFESEGLLKDYKPYEKDGFRDYHLYVRLL